MKYIFATIIIAFSSVVYANNNATSNITHWGKTNTDKVVFLSEKSVWKIPVSHCPEVVEALRSNDLNSVKIHSNTLEKGARLTFNDNLACRIKTVEAS